MVTDQSGSAQSPEDDSNVSRPDRADISGGIQYHVEYCDGISGRIIRDEHVKSFGDSSQPVSIETVFVLIQRYNIKRRSAVDTDDETKKFLAARTYERPSYHMRITSMAVVNALRSVVRYYPGQYLSGDTIEIRHPYPVLVHHFDELTAFRDRCASVSMDELCQRERDAAEHLTLLLEYLDKTIMPGVRLEHDRIRRGYATWEYQWLLFKPGTTVLRLVGDDHDDTIRERPKVVYEMNYGIFSDPHQDWLMTGWNYRLAMGGVVRTADLTEIPKWDGEMPLKFRFFDNETLRFDRTARKFAESGKLYWSMLRKQCRYYNGKTSRPPIRKVECMVMLDTSMYNELAAEVPKSLDFNMLQDLLPRQSDCPCKVCEQKKTGGHMAIPSIFQGYGYPAPESHDTLLDHQYSLLPVEIPAFVFKTRVWEWLRVSNFSDPQFDESMIENLVMDTDRVKSLKALAKSFSRTNKDGEIMTKGQWTADFVKGKGHGLIFLLHGKPGVECIAEFTKRPLMILTSSDIGIDPSKIEEMLTEKFKMAMSWNAVLLIDEADVFMEKRSSSDLTRNSLVAGFLRALEFYDGILFLTTNRVGSFDDAFISRIHVKIYYPDFTDIQRRQVWQTFVDKLKKERGDYMRLSIEAKEYMKGKTMGGIKWNGREIRNAFQTAVALAEYDSEKDDEGKILLTDEHLRAVVELSKEFKDYIDTLYRADESKRAERKHERLDDYQPK